VGEKNRVITYLKQYLQTLGYRVDTEEATKEKTMEEPKAVTREEPEGKQTDVKDGNAANGPMDVPENSADGRDQQEV
jgi:hypothetical protein